MLEIPGEEAPTDPGLQARQRQEQEEKARLAAQKKKNRAVGLVAVLALLVVAGGGAYAWQAQQAAMTYTMEDYYEVALEDMAAPPTPDATAAHPADPAAPPTPGTPAPRAGTNGRKPSTQPQGASQGSEAGLLGTKRATDAGPEDAGVAAGPSTALPGGPSLGTSAIKVSQVASGEVLKDDQQIYDMAKRVINVSNGQVQNCYNQRLKAVPTLQGAWDVSFVIAKDGGVKSVKAAAVNEKDAELEECIVRAVGSWKFQRIARDQPIKKTYRFGASGW
ncbi:MAG: AgmX/PglI C-terminal domain-containing protein [Myxococcota bacterium]